MCLLLKILFLAAVKKRSNVCGKSAGQPLEHSFYSAVHCGGSLVGMVFFKKVPLLFFFFLSSATSVDQVQAEMQGLKRSAIFLGVYLNKYVQKPIHTQYPNLYTTSTSNQCRAFEYSLVGIITIISFLLVRKILSGEAALLHFQMGMNQHCNTV